MQPVSVPDLTARQLHAVSLWLSTIASSASSHRCSCISENLAAGFDASHHARRWHINVVPSRTYLYECRSDARWPPNLDRTSSGARTRASAPSSFCLTAYLAFAGLAVLKVPITGRRRFLFRPIIDAAVGEAALLPTPTGLSQRVSIHVRASELCRFHEIYVGE